MTGMIQLLTITTDERKIGVDSTEVKRALIDAAPADRILIENAKSEERLYKIASLLNLETADDGRSFLVLNAVEGRECIVAFTGTVDFITIGISGILAIPPYIRKKQDPLFVWGFFREHGRLVTLVTFGFLESGGAA